jgi:hypothetical protein
MKYHPIVNEGVRELLFQLEIQLPAGELREQIRDLRLKLDRAIERNSDHE